MRRRMCISQKVLAGRIETGEDERFRGTEKDCIFIHFSRHYHPDTIVHEPVLFWRRNIASELLSKGSDGRLYYKRSFSYISLG